MATVDSTPSIRELMSVFGGGNSLRDFYRGGPLVPNISQNSDISTSSSNLTLRQFIGATDEPPPPPMEVTINPSSVTEITSGSSGSTEPVVASLSGGPGGTVSWLWTRVSGSGNISVASGTDPSTWFNYSGVLEGNPESATFRITATQGGQSASSDIGVSVTRISP